MFSDGSQVARVAKTRRRIWKVTGSSSKTLRPPKRLLVGIEELVVIDFAVLAEYPLMRGLKIRLRRAALDLVAQRVLALIGVGQKSIVEEEHPTGEQASGEGEGQNQTVQADAAGFEGDNFVVFGQHRESDQRRDESGERRKLVHHQRNEIAEIIQHHGNGDVIFRDVAEQIEEREGVEDQDEAREQNQK